VSETYNPAKNRFDKRRGARNEPLDTWVYSYAATHHPELRLHRASKADWDAREARLLAAAAAPAANDSRETPIATPSGAPAKDSRETQQGRRRGGLVDGDWSIG
jgi:phage terminase large subunit GpA-like protein